MIEVWVTLVPSVCWLVYRCYQVLQMPVEELIENLHIEIPHSPNICIDAIDRQSVIFHWDIEAYVGEKLYYVIMLNGREAATVTTSSCKLENLHVDTNYNIRLLAVNSLTNFRSESKTMYFRTLPDENLRIQTILGEENDDLTNVENESNEHTSEVVSHIGIEDIKDINNAVTLNNYLVYFQKELNRTKAEIRSYAENTKREADTLKDKLAQYRREYDEEHDSKLRKDHNIKDLEKRKDKLTFQKSKLLGQIKTVENSFGIYSSKLCDYDKKIRKHRERINSLRLNESNEKQKIHDDIANYEKALSDIKMEIDTIEGRIKHLTVEKKNCITLINSIKPLVEELNSEPLFGKDGSLNKSSYEILDRVIQIIPSWRASIFEEISNIQNSENEWREVYKSEIRKFLSIQNSLEIAKSNKDRNYVPNKMNEHQASIEFGGYNNALPKNRFKKHSSSSNVSPPNSNSERKAVDDSWLENYGNIYGKEDKEEQNWSHANVSSDSGIMPAFVYPNSNSVPATNAFSSNTPVHSADNSIESPTMNRPFLNVPSSQIQETPTQSIITNDQLYGYNSPMLAATSLNHNVWSPNIPMSQSSDFFGQNTGVQNLSTEFSPSVFHGNLGHVSLDSTNLSVDNSTLNAVSIGKSSSQLSNKSNTFPFSNSVWNDNTLHNRNISSNSNSQIWRNDNLSNYSFNIGMDFQPIMHLDNANMVNSVDGSTHIANSSSNAHMASSPSLYGSTAFETQGNSLVADNTLGTSPPSKASLLDRDQQNDSAGAS